MTKHKKTKYWYMHTIEGRPAHFNRNTSVRTRQIIYRHGTGDTVVLVETLKQIREEQQLSKEFRAISGWDIPVYGYVKVVVPEHGP